MKKVLRQSRKVLLTGGHAATPALATLEEIKKRNLDWDIYWIGPRYAMEGKAVKTAAEEILGSRGVKVKKIIAGRRKTKGSVASRVTAHIKIPLGFIHAFFYMAQIRPNIVVSFGGFASVPVVVSAWLLRIPIVIHEQIVGAGLGNKLSSPFAKKIFIARKESFNFFPKSKTSLIGNPQISALFNIKPKTKMGSPKTLFITGGSSGSETINEVVDKILESLLTNFKVIHQVGQNNFELFQKRKKSLPEKLQKNYNVFGYVPPTDIVDSFSEADIIVARSGANTVADIAITKRPAILIPIPWAINNEQLNNAQKAEAAGIATILEQDKLTPETLMQEISKVEVNWNHMVKTSDPGDFELDKTAASKLVDYLEE